MKEKIIVKFPAGVPEEERDRITKNFENTIDEYLEKMKIKKQATEK